METDEFEPRLGTPRSRGRGQSRRFVALVIAAAARAGPRLGLKRRSCSRIGRGAGIGRLLGSSRDPLGGLRARRAVVKTRLVRLGPANLGGAGAHLRYIQRDGVERDGSPGRLYSATEDQADGKTFLERSGGDRHQFRLILSAEDGDCYADLRPLVRRFMKQVGEDLGTRLEWVAADHVDTAHPHSHVILRGKDDLGRNLVIAREYISRGMRERLAQIVTNDLGPRQDVEIRARLRAEITAERLTSIDRALLRSMGAQRVVEAAERDPFRQALRAGRLKKLEALGLAEALGRGRWVLAGDLEVKLRALGERGDIVRTMQRELKASAMERAASSRVIHDGPPGVPVVGRIVARGLADEHADRQFLIVDGTDGRAHWLNIGRSVDAEHTPRDAIVRVSAGLSSGARAGPRPRIEILSPLPLERLAGCQGASWLDRQLVGEEGEPLRDEGFGRQVRSALALRRQWLIDQGLAEDASGELRARSGLLAWLRRNELMAAGQRLAHEASLDFVETASGEQVSGVLRRRVDLASGQFALIEGPEELRLVPWRPVLERYLGREVAGVSRGEDIRWNLGRERSGPAIG